MIRDIYVGWDSRSSIAFDVARNTIVQRTASPVRVVPMKLDHLSILSRPIERKDGKLWCPISQAHMSTEFAISRFCVPFIQTTGWALFTDCDILCWEDVENLFALAEDKYAVMTVKHPIENMITQQVTKMDGQMQLFYNRKNWSSVVLWNCDHEANRRFTLEHLNTWPGRDLHAFKWLEDSEIGELPQKWNWLVNLTPGHISEQGIWHYTLGGPWFEGWKPQPYDQQWLDAKGKLTTIHNGN